MGMGLGKTVCALTAFTGLKMLGLASRMLVVAPLRVAALTWPNEIRGWRHLHELRCTVLRSPEGWDALRSGESDVFTINYEQLPNLVSRYLRGRRSPPAFDVVCFDELTAAKNPKSKRIRALRPYLEANPHIRRWGLTGTPNPNSELELFGQLRLLDDGARLGKTFSLYRSAYFHPTDYHEYNWVINEGSSERIHAKISDICLTLAQADYADFAPPHVEDISVALPDEAKDQYDVLEKELLLSLGDDEDPVVAPNAAALAGKLHQLTGGAMYREDKSVVKIHDAKLKALALLVAKVDAPMIVACNYRHEQERITRSISGAELFTARDSAAILGRWNAGAIRVLVTDPRSIGHGLNLQSGGHHIAWFSPPWSRELYDQLNGRLARKGQKNIVYAYRLLCPGTIDDAIVEALRQRGEGQKALLLALTNLRRLIHLA